VGGKYRFDDIPPEERRRIAEECGLTEEEARVFDMRARTDSVIATAMRLNMSDRTVKRRCQSVAKKMARGGHRDYSRENICEHRANN
jgi:DNA-binding NarL/FixJ family response regulator